MSYVTGTIDMPAAAAHEQLRTETVYNNDASQILAQGLRVHIKIIVKNYVQL